MNDGFFSPLALALLFFVPPTLQPLHSLDGSNTLLALTMASILLTCHGKRTILAWKQIEELLYLPPPLPFVQLEHPIAQSTLTNPKLNNPPNPLGYRTFMPTGTGHLSPT